MSIQEKLVEDLKVAMVERDVVRRSTIRFLRSVIHNEEIARKAPLNDEAVIGVLGKQAKQRRESIEAFTLGNRADLVETEQAELAIIMAYLPEQISAEEITSLARRAIEQVGATGREDMGKVMGRLMPQVKGKADGSAVSAVVSKLLGDALT